jgi:hypothetical protein
MLKAESASETPPFVYNGKDPWWPKRTTPSAGSAGSPAATPGAATTCSPYLVALLEWTLPVPSSSN